MICLKEKLSTSQCMSNNIGESIGKWALWSFKNARFIPRYKTHPQKTRGWATRFVIYDCDEIRLVGWGIVFHVDGVEHGRGGGVGFFVGGDFGFVF